MVLQFFVNVRGLQNAGVMWAEEFRFGFGFAQSIVDRRLFYLHNRPGLLRMVGTFVSWATKKSWRSPKRWWRPSTRRGR